LFPFGKFGTGIKVDSQVLIKNFGGFSSKVLNYFGGRHEAR
jgi:hypothetical protein